MATDTLGTRLRKARTSARLKQAKAAAFLSTRVMTLSAYENDKSVPRVDWLDDAATLYRVSIAWLARGEGEGPSVAA